ncbi:MAG: hypothetical protein JWO78_1810 [Micavibrio sp.]|nr:hypothetical protein [Micavibrio sp.]
MSEDVPEEAARVVLVAVNDDGVRDQPITHRLIHIGDVHAVQALLLALAAENGEKITMSDDVSETNGPVILIADDGDMEIERHSSRRLIFGGFNGHVILAIALAAAADSCAAVSLATLSIPDLSVISPFTLTASKRQVAEYVQARHFQSGNAAHYRNQQTQLSAQYAQAAKWQSGVAAHSGHHSRENRAAVRQRVWASYNR